MAAFRTLLDAMVLGKTPETVQNQQLKLLKDTQAAIEQIFSTLQDGVGQSTEGGGSNSVNKLRVAAEDLRAEQAELEKSLNPKP